MPPFNRAEWVDPRPDAVLSPSPVSYRPNELIVPLAQVDQLAGALGVAPAQIDTNNRLGLARVRLPGANAVPEQLAQLRALAGPLASSTPNYVLAPWVSSGAGGWPQPSQNLVDIAPLGAMVDVAVFDSGLLTGWDQHDYLANAAPVSAADVTPPTGPNGSIALFDSHGMFVAGVLLCAAPTARVKVRKVFGVDGLTDDWSLAAQLDSFLALNPQTRVINLSCGTFADTAHPPAALQQVIANHPLVLFVAAAGNVASTDPTIRVYPAAFDTVVGVGAVDAAGSPTSFSDQPSADVWALGDLVDNAFGRGNVIRNGVPTAFTGTAAWSGTSFAAPLAAAVLTGFMAGPPTAAVLAGSSLLATEAIAWLRARYLQPNGRIVLPHP